MVWLGEHAIKLPDRNKKFTLILFALVTLRSHKISLLRLNTLLTDGN